ncbi:MAG: mucoidy inhibitor MuiA family protein [Prevotellaceae bacterium]|jgi:uncharacterized protein (TIGR02231 family)|nr:mucoidy inhibitor MuiA family protein [Prevotellaceae bacterium]
MKKLLYVNFVALLILSNTLSAQERATAIPSAISGVTVFLKGAEVQRTGTLTLKEGAQRVVFENLPQHINPQSIQVSGTGKFTILGVSHRINYLQPAAATKEVASLEDSLRLLNESIAQQEAALGVIKEEQEMLKANRYIGGSSTGIKMLELKVFADYFSVQLSALSKRMVSTQADVQKLKKRAERIEKQLREMQQRPQRPTSEIVVDLTAPAATRAALTASYLAYNAGWTPAYDLRSAELNKPVTLIYKAYVTQSTGEAWTAVKPIFSTGNPTLNHTKPQLTPWYLSFYEPVRPRFGVVNALQKAAVSSHEPIMAEAFVAEPMAAEAQTAADFTRMNDSQTNVEFAVDVPYSIASDGQEQAVELASYTLPANYEYHAVRKIEKDVFLIANVTGWESLNLLSGQANLFFEGKYVGKSYIETRQTDDTLTLSLGRDRNITVTRIRKKDFSEKQFLGNNVTETREWELTAHNKKKQPVTITLEDQVPVSTDKEIKLETLEISGAQHDPATGKLTWRFELKPSESRAMTVKYAVKHPKSRTVVLE